MSLFRRRPRLPNSSLPDNAWRDHALIAGPLALVLLGSTALVVWLVNPAPPKTITISAGPPDSSFMRTANDYARILARNGVVLKVLPSDGSVQNLHRLLDPRQHVDIALVQGGVADGLPTQSLMSLGSIFYVPIFVFYRGSDLTCLSQLDGKRVAIGREGSGTRMLSLNLLKENGIGATSASLFPYDGMEAASRLMAGEVDAIVLNGDSTSRDLILRLLHVPGVSLMDFSEAAAYTRRFSYLDEIDMPPGVFDLGRKLPPVTVHLISPTVEIVARPNLHPAISDLLIEAAQEVNGPAGLLAGAGKFPSSVPHDYRISADATRYYQSGKGFLYRTLPFWLASFVDRLLVLLLPAAVLFSPALKLVPALLRWRVRSRIYRHYGMLIGIERKAIKVSTKDERDSLVRELDFIEESINRLRMPASYADVFYVLREHVVFVRERLDRAVRADGIG